MRKSKYEGKFSKGYKFGSWEVVNGNIHDSPAQINVKCVCGTEKSVDVYTLVKGKSTSCGCMKVGENAPNWKGNLYGGVPATLMYRAQNSSAGAKGLTYETMATAYVSQGGACSLTGQTLNASNAKLALVDGNKPYESGNITFVHQSVAPVVSSGGISNFTNSVMTISTSNPNIFEQMGLQPIRRKK